MLQAPALFLHDQDAVLPGQRDLAIELVEHWVVGLLNVVLVLDEEIAARLAQDRLALDGAPQPGNPSSCIGTIVLSETA